MQPRSSKSEIIGVYDGLLKVRISSPPVDGQANSACVKYFSKLFKMPKSDIAIFKGERSKRKRLLLKHADIVNVTEIIQKICDAKQ